MKRILTLAELDLTAVPDYVFKDAYWQKCIELALRSRSENQRFGSLVVSGERIIGEGWNRLLGKGEPFPFKTSFFLHAEKDAIGNAILNVGEENIINAAVYVAGFFVKERKPIIFRRPTNTCTSCTKLYLRFGLEAAYLTLNGWITRSGKQAYQFALENQRIRKEKGLSIRQLRKELAF